MADLNKDPLEGLNLSDSRRATAEEVRAAAELVAIDRSPQAADDGRVLVSDAISEQAEAAGFEPDIQARAQPAAVGMVTGVRAAAGAPQHVYGQLDNTAAVLAGGTDADRTAFEDERASKQAALERIESPLSVKVEREAEENPVKATDTGRATPTDPAAKRVSLPSKSN